MALGKSAVSVDRIIMNLRAKTREEAISELVSLFCRTENRTDAVCIADAVMSRERKASTGIQWGIAIPHAGIPGLGSIKVCIGYSSEGIDFFSQDGLLSYIVILILSPETDFSGHIRFLAELSGLLCLSCRRRRLERASTPEEVVSVFTGGRYENY